MNLLVTNTRAAQAYFVIRALRPYTTTIVATMYGKNSVLARLSHAAQSRLVDRRYYVPSPASDWKRGKISDENSVAEEAYIEEVLRICEIETIDTIFPSWDAQLYVFSKNKKRFEEKGILIPIPDFETYRILLDKYRTLSLAQEAGFQCPRTYVPQTINDVSWIGRELGFPVILKPRFASWGTQVVTDDRILLKKTEQMATEYGMPMIQEFVPAEHRRDYHFILDKQGKLKLSFWRTTRRTFRVDLHAHFSTVNELVDPPPFSPPAIGFLHDLGWWGSGIVETSVDSRDGKPKFMELIPRFRRQLWNSVELGINEPMICIRIARGDNVERVRNLPTGTLFLSPLEDCLVLLFQLLDRLLYKLKRSSGRPVADIHNTPPPLKEILRSFGRSYLSNGPRLVDPYFKYFFRDPVVAVLWWLQLSSWVLGLARRLGR